MYIFDTRSVLPVISEWIVRIVESKGKLMFLLIVVVVSSDSSDGINFRHGYRSFRYSFDTSRFGTSLISRRVS